MNALYPTNTFVSVQTKMNTRLFHFKIILAMNTHRVSESELLYLERIFLIKQSTRWGRYDRLLSIFGTQFL